MEIKTFYKTQRELAIILNKLIDAYWNNDITEEILYEKIELLVTNNPGKIIKFDEYTTIVKQQCGKRRLEIIDLVLKKAKLEE